jgi:hypothetical protein
VIFTGVDLIMGTSALIGEAREPEHAKQPESQAIAYRIQEEFPRQPRNRGDDDDLLSDTRKAQFGLTPHP